jgi:hypothetical protein
LHLRSSAGLRGGNRGQVLATAANLGGIGVGPLVAGLLAQYAPAPLRLPYCVFGVALLVLAGLIAISPETAPPLRPRPTWRPQRVAVPPDVRNIFLAATAVGVGAFAVYGVFTSLTPSFLATTLHQTSHALAGAVAFAAFASGALAQLAACRVTMPHTLRLGAMALIPGLALLAAGMWVPSLVVFVIGGIVTGAGSGLLFRGALATATSSAPARARAEVLAAFFLGAYLGLSVPVVGLGVATQWVPPREAMLAFVLFISLGVLAGVRAVRHHTPTQGAVMQTTEPPMSATDRTPAQRRTADPPRATASTGTQLTRFALVRREGAS